MSERVPLPLEGIRVLDLSRVLAGPLCAMTLGDLGAEVVKIERPGAGDETRGWGPPFLGGESAYFLSVNRNKKSVALDLKDPRCRQIVRRMALGSDVVIENFKAGGAGRLGLDTDSLRTEKPELIGCSITGFGSARSPADRPGYDFVIQAEGGLMAITGEPSGTPMKVGVALVDVLAGQNAAIAILAALHRRMLTGVGDRLEVSLLDSSIASLVNVGASALATGEASARFGNAHPNIVPYQQFETSDGWIAIAAANDSLFARLCAAIGLPAVPDDPRFATNPDRVRHREILIPMLAGPLGTRSSAQWAATLAQAGVPFGLVYSPLEAIAAAREAGDSVTETVEHSILGELETLRSPLRFSSSALSARRGPPVLGEHTEEVLRDIGLHQQEVEELVRDRVAGLWRKQEA